MAISLNRATIIGRLGADPEVKSNGDIVTLSVATSERWKNKETGDYNERTQWHKVVIFNPNVGGYVTKYAHKGDLVCVEGQIETRKWDRSADGLEDKYYTEIVVRTYGGNVQVLPKDSADRGDHTPDRSEPYQRKAAEKSGAATKPRASYHSDLDDEIPFAPEWR
jgi:single-strand DNA-binding protein